MLIRLTRGSGISGLAAMARVSPLPGSDGEISLVRPLLGGAQGPAASRRCARPASPMPTIPATAIRASPASGCGPRCRCWSAKGWTPSGWRCWRAGCGGPMLALEAAVDEAVAELAPLPWPEAARSRSRPGGLRELPAEVALRLLGRAIACAGNEGPVELGKLEALHAGLAASPAAVRFRRTLAGAVVTALRRPPGGRARARAPHPRRLEIGLNHTQSCSRASFGTRRPIGLECAGFAGLFRRPVPLAGGNRGPTLAEAVVDHRLQTRRRPSGAP